MNRDSLASGRLGRDRQSASSLCASSCRCSDRHEHQRKHCNQCRSNFRLATPHRFASLELKRGGAHTQRGWLLPDNTHLQFGMLSNTRFRLNQVTPRDLARRDRWQITPPPASSSMRVWRISLRDGRRQSPLHPAQRQQPRPRWRSNRKGRRTAKIGLNLGNRRRRRRVWLRRCVSSSLS